MINCLIYCFLWFALSSSSIFDNPPICRKSPDIVPQNHPLRNIKPFCSTAFYGNTSICGIGIITKNNGMCVKWKSSTYNDNGMLEDTTFCKLKNSYYYCATKYAWDACKDINCSTDDKNNICHSEILWSSTESSVTLNFSQTSNANSMLLFSYGNKDGCFIFQICLKCPEIIELVKNHFATCANLKESANGSKTYSYENLNQNTLYDFYLIPVINKTSIGAIGKVSLRTKSEKPAIPTDVRVINKSTTIIWIQFNSSDEMSLYGPTNEYQIQILDEHNISSSITYTKQTNVVVDRSRTCKVYCFRVSACNNFSSSASSPICTNTTLLFNTVEWPSAILILPTTNNITWSYKNNDDCHITFNVQYWRFDFANETKRSETKNHFIILDDLIDDIHYIVRVRPEFGNEHGNYSTEMTFYTGKVIRQTSKPLWPIIVVIILLTVPLVYYLYRKGYLLMLKRKTMNLVFTRVINRFPSTSRSNHIYETQSDIMKQFNDNKDDSYSMIEDTKDLYGFIKFEGSQIYMCVNDSIRESEYQNVNFVSFLSNPNETEFIIGENPSNESVFDFWYIVWIQKVSIIVLLTSDIYDCMRYLPNEKEAVKKYGKYFQFSIVLKFENETDTHIERRIHLINELKNEERIITHFQIHNWSGFSSSKIHSFDKMILKFQECKENGCKPPYLIHSDINFGGVGAFIVVDRIIGKLLNNVCDINIFREISKIQTNKSAMVHQQAQYIFIPEFIQYFSNKYNKNVNLIDF